MNLVQLRYLVAIVDSGLSVTRAAAQVFATQPGISKQLRQLEAELGFRIFARNGRSLAAVTPKGAQVIARARTIVAEAARIRALAATRRRSAENEMSKIIDTK